MLKKIRAPLGALALALFASGVSAQQYGPPPGQQASPACVRLEAQLATLDSQNQANPEQQQIEANYNQQRANMDAAIAKSRGMGCGRNFLFGPRPPAECRGLEAQIDRMRDNVERLEDRLHRGLGDSGLREARRRDVIASLAQYQCGPQYQAAVPQEQRERGGLFGLLFGSRGGVQDNAPPLPSEIPQSSTFRTVCVRTCDGFFFPVSFATVPAKFGQDDNMCHRTCPGAEAILFTYPNPGGTIEQATSTSGQPYTSLPNAFKYQTEFVKDCSCKPAGKTWEQALSGADDDTVQHGDIVVDEQRSRSMSQPGDGAVTSPDDAARAAQDSASQVTNDGVVEGPANTDPPAGFSQDQIQGAPPRTAEPYYVPPRESYPQQAAPPPAPRQAQPRQRPDPRYIPPQFR